MKILLNITNENTIRHDINKNFLWFFGSGIMSSDMCSYCVCPNVNNKKLIRFKKLSIDVECFS